MTKHAFARGIRTGAWARYRGLWLLGGFPDGVLRAAGIVGFQRDRTRQNFMTLAGWAVLRFTWEDLIEKPDYVIGAIRVALAER